MPMQITLNYYAAKVGLNSAKKRIEEIAVIDNGVGMDNVTLMNA